MEFQGFGKVGKLIIPALLSLALQSIDVALTKLLIAGRHHSEVINLAGDGKNCQAPAKLPLEWDNIGTLTKQDGSLVACGKFINNIFHECQRFDGKTNAWTREEYFMTLPSYAVASAEVSPSKFWFFGDRSSKSEIYLNGVNLLTSNLPEGIQYGCMVKIDDHRSFIASAKDGNGYLFNWGSKALMTYKGLLLEKSASGSMCGIAKKSNGDKVIVIGGGVDYQKKVQVIDVSTMKSHRAADLAHNFQFGASVPYGDTFLVVGGGAPGRYLRTIMQYNPEGETFNLRPESLGDEANHAFVAWLGDDEVSCK